MLSYKVSDEAAALICDGEELSNDELMSFVNDARLQCRNGIQADVFTYNGRTLILTYSAAPLRDRFSASMRCKRSRGKRKPLGIAPA